MSAPGVDRRPLDRRSVPAAELRNKRMPSKRDRILVGDPWAAGKSIVVSFIDKVPESKNIYQDPPAAIMASFAVAIPAFRVPSTVGNNFEISGRNMAG